MKLRILVIVALAIVAVCVWIFVQSDTPRIDSGQAVTNATAPEGGSDARTRPAATANNEKAGSISAATKPGEQINWDRIGDAIAGRVNNKSILTDAQIEEFLRKRGETAMNLLAVWESTQDRRWLDRALQKFPNDPALLLAAIGTTPPPDNTAELIDRLKLAAPDNPIPWIYTARQLFADKRVDEAMAELRTALSKPGFYTYSSERILASKQLFLDSGFDPIGAEFLAMSQQQLGYLTTANITVKAMKEWAGSEGVTAENRNEAIKLSYEMGKMFSTPEASRTLLGQLVAVAMERQALTLAQSQADNPLPVNTANRMAELDQFRAELPKLANLTDKMVAKNDPQLFGEYLRRFRTEGEAAALKWVGQEMR
jgi:hypothetical protein